MKKLLPVLLVLMLTIVVMAGCGSDEAFLDDQKGDQDQSEQDSESSFPVTITDALDKEVVIEEKPDRIVSLMPSNTEIAFELGLGEKIVGVSDFDNYPKEVADIEKIGGQKVNIEKIIALKPDLVLAHASSANNSAEGLQLIRESGISVVTVNDSQNFDQVYKSIEMIGKVTDTKNKAEQIIKNMKDKIKSIQEKASEVKDPKSVFIEVSPAPEIYTPGKKTFMNEMLTIINAKNVSSDLVGWAKVDEEAVVQKNPDVIITTYGYYTENATEKVLKRDGWQDISAVKNKQVYDVHSDLVTRSGPRLAKGVEELAKAVYPELFSGE